MPPEGDESPVPEVHTPVQEKKVPARVLEMWTALHEPLPAMWIDIVMTHRLHPPDFALGNEWFRFPLRNMRPLSPEPSSHFQTATHSISDYHGKVVVPGPDGNFTLFHMAQVHKLVSSHEGAPGSSGILADAGMRYGLHHGDGIGVYGYASPPVELFGLNDGWCLLELKVRPHLTRVKNGSRGRYVVKSDQSDVSIGAECPDCTVVAMLHLYSTLPTFLKF
jgi:hypothetical protein